MIIVINSNFCLNCDLKITLSFPSIAFAKVWHCADILSYCIDSSMHSDKKYTVILLPVYLNEKRSKEMSIFEIFKNNVVVK